MDRTLCNDLQQVLVHASQGILDHLHQEALVLSSNLRLNALHDCLSVFFDVGLFNLAHNRLVSKDGTSQANFVCKERMGKILVETSDR